MPLHMDIISDIVNMDAFRMELKEMINHVGDTKKTKVTRPGTQTKAARGTGASLEVSGTLNALP